MGAVCEENLMKSVAGGADFKGLDRFWLSPKRVDISDAGYKSIFFVPQFLAESRFGLSTPKADNLHP